MATLTMKMVMVMENVYTIVATTINVKKTISTTNNKMTKVMVSSLLYVYSS